MSVKKIACPVCGYKRLIDANILTKSELIPEENHKLNEPYDYVQKCKGCKREIYIRKVG